MLVMLKIFSFLYILLPGNGHNKPTFATLNKYGQLFLKNEYNCHLVICLHDILNTIMTDSKFSAGLNDLLSDVSV